MISILAALGNVADVISSVADGVILVDEARNHPKRFWTITAIILSMIVVAAVVGFFCLSKGNVG